jgi:hypothetical protein
VFFIELVYERSKDVFRRLGVQQLPFVFHWGPEAVAREGRSIKIPKSSEVRVAGVAMCAELGVELLRCAMGRTALCAVLCGLCRAVCCAVCCTALRWQVAGGPPMVPEVLRWRLPGVVPGLVSDFNVVRSASTRSST